MSGRCSFHCGWIFRLLRTRDGRLYQLRHNFLRLGLLLLNWGHPLQSHWLKGVLVTSEFAYFSEIENSDMQDTFMSLLSNICCGWLFPVHLFFHHHLCCNELLWWLNLWTRQSQFRGFSRFWFPLFFFAAFLMLCDSEDLSSSLPFLALMSGKFSSGTSVAFFGTLVARRAGVSRSRRLFWGLEWCQHCSSCEEFPQCFSGTSQLTSASSW